MKSLMFAFALLMSASAFATPFSIQYGRMLCSNVTYQTPTRGECENFVIENSDKRTIFGLALGACIGFNTGPASRTEDCLEHAAKFFGVPAMDAHVEACRSTGVTYEDRAECLASLFTRLDRAAVWKSQASASASSSATAPNAKKP